MNILFLDFDGVLVPIKESGRKTRPAVPKQSCVVALNGILRDAEAGIVVSSSWRCHTTVAKLQKCLDDWGVVGKIVGTTPVLFDRSKEILRWLEINVELVSSGNWAVLDDQELQMPHFVKCDPLTGLTDELAAKAVSTIKGLGKQ